MPLRRNGASWSRGAIPEILDATCGVLAIPDDVQSLAQAGLAALTLDLSDTRSLPEALAKTAAYAKAHPDRPWIIGRGWNQELWPEKRFPTAAELDAVVPDRPVWLARVDGHAGWGNSKALSAAGVTAATRDPAGGKIERSERGAEAAIAQLVARGAAPLAAGEDRDVLEHGLAAITEARRLDGGDLQAFQPARRCKVAERGHAVSESDHEQRRRQGEAEPRGEPAGESALQVADAEAGLAARGTGQKLAHRDEVGVGRIIEPAPPGFCIVPGQQDLGNAGPMGFEGHFPGAHEGRLSCRGCSLLFRQGEGPLAQSKPEPSKGDGTRRHDQDLLAPGSQSGDVLGKGCKPG